MSTQPLPTRNPPKAPRLRDVVRQAAHARFGRDGPGERYAHWTRRLVVFHNNRHPRDLQLGDIRRFLEYIAQTEKDPLNCLVGKGRKRGRTSFYHVQTPQRLRPLLPSAALTRRSRSGL
jgi:hypothetical protein